MFVKTTEVMMGLDSETRCWQEGYWEGLARRIVELEQEFSMRTDYQDEWFWFNSYMPFFPSLSSLIQFHEHTAHTQITDRAHAFLAVTVLGFKHSRPDSHTLGFLGLVVRLGPSSTNMLTRSCL